MRLEKTESNSLYKTIVEAGLDPNEFRLESNARWPGLVHRESNSYFLIKQSYWNIYKFKTKYIVNPGRESLGPPLLWSDVLNLASQWCEGIKAPDLWYNSEAAKAMFADAVNGEEPENTPFTPAEQGQISVQLAQIKETLESQYTLSSEALSQVRAKLDEAEKASRRMGRKDWLLLFSGTVLTLIVTDVVTPDVAHHIFMMTIQGLGHLFNSAHASPRPLSQK